MIDSKFDTHSTIDFPDGVVLVTGAGGTIGSNIVSRINARTIIALDISEYAIYKLRRLNLDKNIQYIVGDASDERLLDAIFQTKIDCVFNCAAYKHVDAMEDPYNIYSVIKNNILSTYLLCQRAERMVHISSDKAVYPVNNMGYTKLWCERIVQSYDKNFTIVRFGNVFESNGSFIETLKWQIQNKLPITLTDPEMKRYFITITDAVELICKIVGMERQNTYILDMGEEVSILDVINHYNKDNLPVTITGIRPGEKLHETLHYKYEQATKTEYQQITRIAWDAKQIMIEELLSSLKEPVICTQTLVRILQTITNS